VDRHLTSCQDGPLPLDDLLDLDGCWNVGQFFYQPEVAFSRGLWERAGGHVDETSFYSMDYELWLRFAAAGARLKVIGRPVAQFRLHRNQKTADPRLFQAELPTVRDRFLKSRGLEPRRPTAARPPRRPARIVFLNDIGFRYGAGIAHQRLAASAEMAGHKVIPVSAAQTSRFASLLPARKEERVVSAVSAARPDVVIVGNLHGAGMGASLLAEIAERWPTAFVVHDLWIATGRCAYTKGCDKFVAGCDDTCPTPAEYPALAPPLIAPAWAAKRRLLKSPQAPLLLANSDWTAAELRRAFGDGAASPGIVPITLGVGSEFVPADKRECRRLLSLPERAFIILLSATSLSDPRKGRTLLLAALSQLSLPDAELLFVGAGEDVDVPGFPVHRFVHQDDPQTMAMIFAAADLFVGPSTEEALGQVFLEAAACGVPSVGFAVGGVPEAILDGITGVIVPELTADALATAIRRVYEDPDYRRALSAWARLAFENDRTLERVYHRLHGAMRRSLRDGERLFSRKVNLRPVPSAGGRAVDPPADLRGADNWEAVRGFGPWEGPYPDLHLARCRWQESLSSSIRLTGSEGPCRVLLRYRNFAPDQHLRISAAGEVLFSGAVPVTGHLQDGLLTFGMTLDASPALLSWEASSAIRSPEGRSLVLLVCGLHVVPHESGPSMRRRWRNRAVERLVRLAGRIRSGLSRWM
jgi:hypothetical protein